MSGVDQLLSLQIDGRSLRAPAGSYVLQVARAAGIDIPTLCDHPAVEPVGGCRLCMVEVSHPDWGGWSGLMTACLYPVSEGIIVETQSPRVVEARRRVLSLLAARCPGAPVIQQLAARYDAPVERLRVEEVADQCILCGLCTRICEAYGPAAITTHQRGATKKVGAFADRPPDECVGCGACAFICPTGQLSGQRTAEGGYRIWSRSFATATCEVTASCCSGCGRCEEACPFSVARVVLRRHGQRLAVIPAEHCRGCGVCVGACPSGAITQQHYDWTSLRRYIGASRPGGQPRTLAVLACARAHLTPTRLPAGVQLLEVPCVGRISLPLLLAGIAGGNDGLLVLGRHQESCRLRGSEDAARDCCHRASQLLDLVGLDGRRIAFVTPEPGGSGPRRAVEGFYNELQSWSSSPLASHILLDASTHEGIDATLHLLREISPRAPVPSNRWLEDQGIPVASPGRPVLLSTALPFFHLLGQNLWRPLDLPLLLQGAILALHRAGVPAAGVWLTGLHPEWTIPAWLREAPGLYVLSPAEQHAMAQRNLTTAVLDEFLLQPVAAIPRPDPAPIVACAGAHQETTLLRRLGCQVVELGPSPLPQSFRIGPAQRSAAEEYLARAQRSGAEHLLVSSVQELLHWILITRQGTWRSNRVQPVLGFQLVWPDLLQASPRTVAESGASASVGTPAPPAEERP